MLNTVKNVMHSIGDGTGDLAKRVGGGTADVAKRVGKGSVKLARRVGPTRGLIGLVIVAAAVGGSIVLVRYLRGRKADSALENEDASKPMSKRAATRNAKLADHAPLTH